MRQHPVQEAVVSHALPRHIAQLEYNHLRRSDIWQEKPFEWEAPYYLRFKRDYQRGPYEYLTVKIELIPVHKKNEKWTEVEFLFEGTARGFMGFLRAKRHFATHFKQRIRKILKNYDESIQKEQAPKGNLPFWSRFKISKWNSLQKKLCTESDDFEISEKLIQFIRCGDEQDLKEINPIRLADLWSVPLHRVLETAYHAVLLNILNMEWHQKCPQCRRPLKVSRKLMEISKSHYCKHCGDTMSLDLNNTTQLIFKCHPLVRKLSENVYCDSGPAIQPHIFLQQYIQPGSKRYVQLTLPEGNYKVHTDTLNRDAYVKSEISGLDNVTLTLENGEKTDKLTRLSPQSDMIMKNKTNRPLLISIEDTRWAEYGVSAAEVTSQQLYRDCFPKELLRPSQKMKCTELSVLFTDLIDSASIYTKGGDEDAIRQVMDHFEVLRKIIREERGSVVKTIGDAIMAVFRKPNNAVRAYRKAQDYFNSSEKTDHKIKIKGGLHSGNCYAVTLNNRIDYFGNTVNLAARLVEKANSDELVISDETLENRDLQNFLERDDVYCEVTGFDSKIKGFGDKLHPIKRLSLMKPKMKLVV